MAPESGLAFSGITQGPGAEMAIRGALTDSHRRMASRYFTAGETRQGSDRISPARATERAMVLNQPVDQFDPLARIGPVTEIVPGTSAMRR
jgi:hypothetical protein